MMRMKLTYEVVIEADAGFFVGRTLEEEADGLVDAVADGLGYPDRVAVTVRCLQKEPA